MIIIMALLNNDKKIQKRERDGDKSHYKLS
jgi:hypothetical protein